MTSMERYQKMLSLQPYASRDEMPVFPMMLASYGRLGGVLQKDILASADKWIELLEQEGISYCMWALSKAPEACSAIRMNVLKYSGFEWEDYTETGKWLMETLKKYNSR